MSVASKQSTGRIRMEFKAFRKDQVDAIVTKIRQDFGRTGGFEGMITPLHHSDYTLKNRAFNCRMRNRYYEEVYYAFRALFPNEIAEAKNPTPEENNAWYQHLSKDIKRYERLIMTCLEYAQAAIFYGKAENKALYSKDKRWGILQEEIFLVHFLQELLSTTRYVIARIDTDQMLQQWSGKCRT